jgi:hypothetical protein
MSSRTATKTKTTLELNRTHQLLVYADDVTLLSRNINIIKKNKPILSDARKKVWLRTNAEKTKYMFMSHLYITRGKIIYK